MASSVNDRTPINIEIETFPLTAHREGRWQWRILVNGWPVITAPHPVESEEEAVKAGERAFIGALGFALVCNNAIELDREPGGA